MINTAFWQRTNDRGTLFVSAWQGDNGAVGLKVTDHRNYEVPVATMSSELLGHIIATAKQQLTRIRLQEIKRHANAADLIFLEDYRG